MLLKAAGHKAKAESYWKKGFDFIVIVDMKKIGDTMNRIFFSVVIVFLVTAGFAQDRASLRDSLAVAVDRLSYKPDSLDLRLKKASWNVQLEQWQYAKDEYDYVLGRDPKNAAALFYRAYVNEKMKRYGFARLDYENLLSVLPGNFEGQLGLALLNQKDHRYTDAIDQINMLVAQYPDSAVAYAARGGIEMERKMYDLAEFDYGKAIELAPDEMDYRMSRVNVRLLLRRKSEAREDLDEIVRRGIPRANLTDWYMKCR